MSEYRQVTFQLPAGATELILVRHGESRAAIDGNPFPMVDGRGDPELHPNGEIQAKAIRDKLKHERIDAIYVTSLRRTHQTAAPLADTLGMTPTVEARLREVCLGEWEGGLFRIKAHQKDPTFLRIRSERRWDVIPGAESKSDLDARVLPALDHITSKHADQRVVLVLHGGIIAHILEHATGANAMAFSGADNGSISKLVRSADDWVIRSFNDTSHLPVIEGANHGLS